MNRWTVTVISTVMALAFGGCAHKKQKDGTLTSAPPLIGPHYAALNFKKGEATLTELNKRELNELALRANRDGRAIGEIRILAWSDEEYPKAHRRTSPADSILAKERAQVIKHYIQSDLHSRENVASYNMAKRPHLLGHELKSDEWAVKEAFEKTGITASNLPDGQVSHTKASRALVIIDYLDKKNQ